MDLVDPGKNQLTDPTAFGTSQTPRLQDPQSDQSSDLPDSVTGHGTNYSLSLGVTGQNRFNGQTSGKLQNEAPDLMSTEQVPVHDPHISTLDPAYDSLQLVSDPANAQNCESRSSSRILDQVEYSNDTTENVQNKTCLCCPRNVRTTPPNYKYIGLVCIALFAGSFSLSFLSPFLPDMIKWLGYSEEDKGYYVGMVSSSLYASRICSSFFWGWLSDIKGRKLVLLLTLAGSGLFFLLFGLSVNMAMAMIFRFLAGLVNGIVGTVKTVLYEVSDETNQAVGMSSISVSWVCGVMLGSTTGGYLASPAVKYPGVFRSGGFFADFPFFLPSLVSATVCFISFIVILVCFEETLIKSELETEVSWNNTTKEKKNLLEDQATRISDAVKPNRLEDLHCEVSSDASTEHTNRSTEITHVSHKDKTVPEQYHPTKSLCHKTDPGGLKDKSRGGLLCETETQTDIYSNTVAPEELVEEEGVRGVAEAETGFEAMCCLNDEDSGTVRTDCDAPDVTTSTQHHSAAFVRTVWSTVCRSRLVTLLHVTDIRNSILLYTVLSIAVIGSEDVFTVFLSTDHSYNGLGFDSNQIGLTLGVVWIPCLILQLFIFPALVRRFGIKKIYMCWGVILMVLVQTMPMLAQLYERQVILWVLLLLIVIPERMASESCSSSASLMINNSTRPENAGTVNGIAMTFTSIARTIAPTVGGSIYAWSINSEQLGPPFDHNLAFVLFGVVFFISVIVCLLLPERLNQQTRKS